MAMTLHCDIVSAEEAIFSGLVELVVAHGSLGDLGICYGHAPLLTALQPGPVRLKLANGEEQIFYVSGGFLEAQPSLVTILADTAVRADEVDEAAATAAQQEAQRQLTSQAADIDFDRAAAQLAAAAGQLRALQQIRKKRGSN